MSLTVSFILIFLVIDIKGNESSMSIAKKKDENKMVSSVSSTEGPLCAKYWRWT